MKLWSYLNKSKKIRVVSLWNDLPWFYNAFQVEEVRVCFGIVKNSGFSVLHNHSRIGKRQDMPDLYKIWGF